MLPLYLNDPECLRLLWLFGEGMVAFHVETVRSSYETTLYRCVWDRTPLPIVEELRSVHVMKVRLCDSCTGLWLVEILFGKYNTMTRRDLARNISSYIHEFSLSILSSLFTKFNLLLPHVLNLCDLASSVIGYLIGLSLSYKTFFGSRLVYLKLRPRFRLEIRYTIQHPLHLVLTGPYTYAPRQPQLMCYASPVEVMSAWWSSRWGWRGASVRARVAERCVREREVLEEDGGCDSEMGERGWG